jgi:hypothetical protein
MKRALTLGFALTLTTLLLPATLGADETAFPRATTNSPAGGDGHTIQDEGIALPARDNLDFTGAGASCTDSGGKTVCDFPGPGTATILDQTAGETDMRYDDTAERYWLDIDGDGTKDNGEAYIDSPVYRSENYTTGSSTSGMQEAYNAAIANGVGIVELACGDIVLSEPFFSDPDGLGGSTANQGVIIKGCGQSRMTDATNVMQDALGTRILWDDAATDPRWIDKPASLSGVSANWAVGDTVAWAGGGAGVIRGVNFTTRWVEVETTAGSTPGAAETITNDRSAATFATTADTAAMREFGAMLNLEGSSYLQFQDLAVVGDEGNDGSNNAKYGAYIRANDANGHIASDIRFKNVKFVDFAYTGTAPRFSGAIVCDGNWPTSATHSGQCDQIKMEDVELYYPGDIAYSQWASGAVGNLWNGGLITGQKRIGVLIAEGASMAMVGVDGVGGTANSNRTDDPAPGEVYGSVIIHPWADSFVVSIVGSRFENQVGRLGFGNTGVCSEDPADSTQDPIEWTLCTNDAECSGTCDYVISGKTSTGVGYLGVFGGGVSQRNTSHGGTGHTGANNAASLTDSTAKLTADGERDIVGLTLHNVTDSSSCTITSATATTAACTLAGGSENDWDTGDLYDIGPITPVNIVMDGSAVFGAVLSGQSGTGSAAKSNVVSSNPDRTGILDYFGPNRIGSNVFTTNIEQNTIDDDDGIARPLFGNFDEVLTGSWTLGTASATTPAANDDDTSVATTEWVQDELTAYASDTKQFTNTTIVGGGAHDLGSATSLEIPNGADPNTSAAGQIAFDTDRYAAGRGTLEFYDGTASVFAVGTTDAPADGQVPKFVAATGTIEWQADADSGAGAGTLDNLTNVDTALKNDGDILVWNATSGNWEDAAPSSSAQAWTVADPVLLSTTTSDVVVGTGQVNSAKFTVDGDADQVQVTVQGAATQTDSVVIVENSGGTEVVNLNADGAVLAQSLSDIDGPGTNWSISSAGAATFTSITTAATAAPAVTLNDSDSASEATDATITAQATDTGAGTEDVDVVISTQVNSTLTARITIDADGNTTIPSYDGAGIVAGSVGDSALAAGAVDGGAGGEINDDSVTADDLAATITFADGDLVTFAAVNGSSTTEGLILPQAASVASCTAEGQICWDTDNVLYIGNGGGTQTAFSAGGDNVSVDGGAVTDPDFVSTGDVNVTDTANTITFDYNADSLLVADVADGDWGDFSVATNVATLDANTVDGAELASLTKSIPWSMGGTLTDGAQCAAAAAVTINSGPKTYTVVCTDNDAGTIFGDTIMPDGWDGGDVVFRFQALNTAADTNVIEFDFSAMCRADGDAVNSTYGSEPASPASITFTTANDIETSSATTVTPNGTCTNDATHLYWRAQLDATATTTAVATAHTVGIIMEYQWADED